MFDCFCYNFDQLFLYDRGFAAFICFILLGRYKKAKLFLFMMKLF